MLISSGHPTCNHTADLEASKRSITKSNITSRPGSRHSTAAGPIRSCDQTSVRMECIASVAFHLSSSHHTLATATADTTTAITTAATTSACHVACSRSASRWLAGPSATFPHPAHESARAYRCSYVFVLRRWARLLLRQSADDLLDPGT